MRNRKVISLAFLVMLMAVVIVSAEPIFEEAKQLFVTDWIAGDFDIGVAKYLFFFLLTILIYSIVGFIPFIKVLHGGAKFLLSAIVAFLGTAYLTTSDLYTILTNYEALGIVLGAGLPFIILLFFSIEVAKEGKAGGRLASKVMWFAFIVFILYKVIIGIGEGKIDYAEGWAYGGIVILSIIYIVYEGKIMKLIFKEELETHKSNLEREIAEQDAKRKTESKSLRDT